MQLGLAFLLGCLTIALAHYGWLRFVRSGHPATLVETMEPSQAPPVARVSNVRVDPPENPQPAYPRKPLPTVVIDLNQATRKELMDLPGIREVLADRILADRQKQGPYRSVDELDRVFGIGKKTIEKIRPYVFVEEERRRKSGNSS
jgi:competence ComEA-like helix-hairpin-helix protein